MCVCNWASRSCGDGFKVPIFEYACLRQFTPRDIIRAILDAASQKSICAGGKRPIWCVDGSCSMAPNVCASGALKQHTHTTPQRTGFFGTILRRLGEAAPTTKGVLGAGRASLNWERLLTTAKQQHIVFTQFFVDFLLLHHTHTHTPHQEQRRAASQSIKIPTIYELFFF